MKRSAFIQLLIVLSWAPLAAARIRGGRALSPSTRKISTFHEIKLTPQNEVSPSRGVDDASGVAIVQLDYDELRVNAKWKACLQSDVHGFAPGLLGIHKGKIYENRKSSVIDFSSMLRDGDPFLDGCVAVSEDLFDDILENPVRRHTSVILGSNLLLFKHNFNCF
jgi:hypothetical protein